MLIRNTDSEILEVGGSCPNCSNILIQFVDKSAGGLRLDACVHCTYANGIQSNNRTFPHAINERGNYIWEFLKNKFNVTSVKGLKAKFQIEFVRANDPSNRNYHLFNPVLVQFDPRQLHNYLLDNEYYNPTNSLNSHGSCICESIDLFRFGCKCGAV